MIMKRKSTLTSNVYVISNKSYGFEDDSQEDNNQSGRHESHSVCYHLCLDEDWCT